MKGEKRFVIMIEDRKESRVHTWESNRVDLRVNQEMSGSGGRSLSGVIRCEDLLELGYSKSDALNPGILAERKLLDLLEIENEELKKRIVERDERLADSESRIADSESRIAGLRKSVDHATDEVRAELDRVLSKRFTGKKIHPGTLVEVEKAVKEIVSAGVKISVAVDDSHSKANRGEVHVRITAGALGLPDTRIVIQMEPKQDSWRELGAEPEMSFEEVIETLIKKEEPR